jgi:heat shock protein HtpX
MYDLISKNIRRSWAIMAIFIAVFLAIGYGVGATFHGGFVGMAIMAVLAVIMSLASYYTGDLMVLGVTRARPVTPQQEPRLHNLVEGLCIAAGIPKPKVYIVEDQAPNAFATGRDPEHASIAVTRGLLDKMNRVELEGVVAHELAHVKDRDTRVMVIAATLVGVIVLVSDFVFRSLFWGGHDSDDSRGAGLAFAAVAIVLWILSPIVAAALQAAVSRRREGLADVSGVALTRYPPGLVSALRKLRDDRTVVRTASRATAALWIESPLQRGSGLSGWYNRLFDTHPPLDERIKILEEL